MSLKTDAKDLENLINASTGANSTGHSNILGDQFMGSDLPDMEPEPTFEINYDRLDKLARRKARSTVIKIAKHIIPTEILEDDYIKDKIKQDIDTLSGLYLQHELNLTVLKSNIETIRYSGGGPRLYESYVQISKNQTELNKQIVQTETVLRQTYTVLKHEARSRKVEEQKLLSSEGGETLSIGPGEAVITGKIHRGSKTILEEMQKAKLKAYVEAEIVEDENENPNRD